MWSLLLFATTVWSFAHLPLGLSDRNKMGLWPGCEGRAKCNLHKKNVRSVRFVAKRRGCFCNLSVGVALNVRFTTNGMCAKNNTNRYVARTSNNRSTTACDLCCCLLPRCEALRTCRLGFPITTPFPRFQKNFCKCHSFVMCNETVMFPGHICWVRYMHKPFESKSSQSHLNFFESS